MTDDESALFPTLKRRPSLSRTVQDELKRYIVRRGLKPGDALPTELSLAQQLGVSRGSVREAVKSMEALGILEARPGAGLFVNQFSLDPILEILSYGMSFDLNDLNDILEVRFFLESGMIERAVEFVTPEQLAQLHVVAERMRADSIEGRYSAEDDRQFHTLLWTTIANPLMGKILDTFWAVFHETRVQAEIPEPVQPADTYRRHVAVLEALEQKDVAAMRTSLVRHYVGIRDRIRQVQQKARGLQDA